MNEYVNEQMNSLVFIKRVYVKKPFKLLKYLLVCHRRVSHWPKDVVPA